MGSKGDTTMQTNHPTTTLPATEQQETSTTRHSLPGTLTKIVFLASMIALVIISAAHAGTYVINNCPSAPLPNGDPGPWVISGGAQPSKASCSGGAGDWIGPRGITMGAASFDGVQVTVPVSSTITIREAKVWWSVPHSTSGADNFAIAYANSGEVGTGKTPPEWISAPDVIALPSTTTMFKLTDYCSNDDAGQPCTFGSMAPNLELYGSQLTLAASHLPSGKTTGGGLSSTSVLTGTQSLAYEAQDTDTGVRAVRLLIDGQTLASNDYLAYCPYTNFLACPASESDTISWNTATVTDGPHDAQAVVENSAQNTSIFYDGTITTHNAPANTSLPTLIASQFVVGTTLSTNPGAWTAPNGAGSITYSYSWEDCDTQGNNCQTIPGAQNANYTPAPSDIGHALRTIVTATDNDGSSSATSAASSVVLAGSGSLGALPGPGTGSTPAVTTTTPATGAFGGLGTSNGTPAAETAVLHLGIAGKISRSFAKRAFKITGRLTNNQGNPIAGANLDVLQQIAGSSTPRLVKHARTSPGGTFTVSVPAGPSRRVEIAYRAFTHDAGYTTTTTIVETVAAGVRLNITPHKTNPTGTIALRGRVSGPIPHQGAIIELLVHYHGEWVPLHESLRTNSHGSFHVAYQFKGAIGHFPVWAKVPSGQTGFPYSRGYSNIINVTTR
jgi:hypothetical protein